MTRANRYTFQVEGNGIAYQKIGNGPSILLAFHGFGQSGEIFRTLEASLGAQFTIFAIDLFFHGHSQYTGNQLLKKHDWQRFIAAFLKDRHIDRFSLMGFSLGGRFSLALAEAFADRLDQLILLAPDGITRSSWYRLATVSAVGRGLFRYVLRHLSVLNAFGHMLTRLGLLNRTVMRFAEISLGTPEQRQLVYRSWTQFRLITPDLTNISRLLNANPVQVQFFIGAFDRIVPGSYILPLTKRLRHYEVTVLKTGHNRLIELMSEKFA
ncbi:alpha/beta hydrolase [Spirosoma sp. KCTC 42546]|uniref:alpha/beta fold hydrolase n=1 Tax=Spirosoma sp. KCTC 42546 TaxID=2520506 RepID=UPI00115AA304|nr:alpha/beta hydrolase [Spirosoma sp. KCTC 42546]QDK77136.1 alpha/beta hydrolase [Spirosoma sp. KCTC 42546]